MSKIIRQIISTSKAPRPIAPYSQAVRVDNLVFLSGVLGMDKETNALPTGPVDQEAKQLMRNMEGILKAAGSGLDKLVKATIMLDDMKHFPIVNAVYKEFIKENFPARSTYQVAKLPMNARVEIEAIGLCGDITTVIVEED